MTSLKNLIFILFYILHDLQVPLFSFNSVDTFYFFWGGGGEQYHTSCSLLKAIPVFFLREAKKRILFYNIIITAFSFYD